MSLSILHVGISLDEVGAAVGTENAAKWIDIIKAGVAKDAKRFRGAGCKFESILYGSVEGMARLEEKCREVNPDGVCVAWGIRKTVEMTPFFEALMHTIHSTLPHTKLLFNTGPDGTFDAARRQSPELAQAGEGGDSV